MIGLYPAQLPLTGKQSDLNHFVGIQVACREFVKNLARYSTEQVCLFVPTSEFTSVQGALELNQAIEGGLFSTCRVRDNRALPEMLKQGGVTAMHNVAGPQLNKLSYIRSQFGAKTFPITAVTHGFSIQSLLFEFFIRLWLTPTLPCDSIICTSDAARQAFKKLLAQTRQSLEELGINVNGINGRDEGALNSDGLPFRLDLIPLGIDTESYQPRDKADLRRQLGLPADKILLLYFGRIDHIGKADLNPLLCAFAELKRQHGDQIGLIMAGNATSQDIGALQQACTRLALGNEVILRAYPTVIEGPLYYGASDIFIGLSDTLQESFGLSILEAMASGLPVVASDWSGYRESVITGETGFLVPTIWAEVDGDISLFSPLHEWTWDHVQLSQSIATEIPALVKSLNTLIGNPELRAQMGLAARKRALANYSWDVVIARYRELWQELSLLARSFQETPQLRPLERPHFFEAYCHFATKCLKGRDQLFVTDRGQHALGTPETVVIYGDMQPNLSHQILVAMLSALASRPTASAYVEDLCAEFVGCCSIPPASVMNHILWLIKYGLMSAEVVLA